MVSGAELPVMTVVLRVGLALQELLFGFATTQRRRTIVGLPVLSRLTFTSFGRLPVLEPILSLPQRWVSKYRALAGIRRLPSKHPDARTRQDPAHPRKVL